MEGDKILAHNEEKDSKGNTRYSISFVYNETKGLRMKYDFNSCYHTISLKINTDSINIETRKSAINLDSYVKEGLCQINLELVLVSLKGTKNVSITQCFNKLIHHRQQDSKLKEQTAEYARLYKELENLPSYKDYQKLFFEVERKLREAIGILHYKENHVTDEQSEEKLFERIASVIEVGVFNSIHHAGFDVATGKPFAPSVPESFAPTVEIKDVEQVKQEIVRIQKEIDRRKNQVKYFEFWEALHPILQPFWSEDDDSAEHLTAAQEDISNAVNKFELLIKKAGFILKYYEDYEDKECMDAKIYIIEGKYGFPALHDSEGALVTNCEGRRDNN